MCNGLGWENMATNPQVKRGRTSQLSLGEENEQLAERHQTPKILIKTKYLPAG